MTGAGAATGGATAAGAMTGAGAVTGSATGTGVSAPFVAGPVSITRRWRLTTSSCGSAWRLRPRSHVFQTAWSAIRYS